MLFCYDQSVQDQKTQQFGNQKIIFVVKQFAMLVKLGEYL